jgi:hypothetical protein
MLNRPSTAATFLPELYFVVRSAPVSVKPLDGALKVKSLHNSLRQLAEEIQSRVDREFAATPSGPALGSCWDQAGLQDGEAKELLRRSCEALGQKVPVIFKRHVDG